MSSVSEMSGTGNSPMSKLEQLARKRTQQRNSTQQEVTNSSSSIESGTKKESLKERLAALKQNKANGANKNITSASKGSSLLESLKNKKRDSDNIKTTRLSLAQRLQKTKTNNIDNTPELSSSNSSLSSKLDLFRKKQQQQTESSKSPEATEIPSSENSEASVKLSSPTSQSNIDVKLDWKKFNELKQKSVTTDSMTGIETDNLLKSGFINFVNRPVPNHNFEKLLKRRRNDIFAVYQPFESVKKQKMIEKFSEPSPDDIIIEAQAKVFDEVTNNVADLNLVEKNKEDHELALPSKPRILLDVAKYLTTKSAHLNISILGHHSSGKSTIMGRMLMDLKQIDIEEIRKLKNICERAKIENQNTYLTWITDTTDSERSKGYSEQVHEHDIKINDNNDQLSFFVNPSEQNTSSGLISQVSNADVVVMVIDCSPDGFEQGFNLNGQTIEHSVITKLCNVKHIIVTLNKMDTIDWYQGRYNEIVNELEMFYDKLGVSSDSISWIPVSGVTGEGLVTKNTSINWYNGPSLLEILSQKMQAVSKKKQNFHNDEFFSLSIKDIKPETNEIAGWITNGYIQAGESITVYPLNKNFLVDEIKNDTDGKQIGTPSSFVTLKLLSSLSKLEKNMLDNIEIGDFATSIITPVTVLNSKTIKLEVPISLVKFTVGMKLIINRQMYSNTVKILKLNKGPKKNKTIIIECELLKDDTLPYFPQGNQKDNYMILRSSGTNRTVGLGKLME